MPFRVRSTKPSQQPRTSGVSRKLVAALAPPLTTIVGTLITTGTLDRAQLAVAASIVLGGALAYFSAPDAVAVPATTTPLVLTGVSTTAATADWTTLSGVSAAPADDEDGDDGLPPEVENHLSEVPPPDEIDQPDDHTEARS